MYGKSGVRGSDSGYCDIQNESRHSSSDYLIHPQSSMGVESRTRLELGDGDRPRCSPRRLSTDLITPQMSVTSENVDSTSADSPRSRVTGSSCQALRHAVAALNRLDDFTSEKIGSGFFSEVFKVTHRTTGQVMVLKMNLLRSNRPNMLKEVQLMNQLSHPNILGFMGVCVHEGQLHALTEFINGGSLEQLNLNASQELPHRTRMRLALDIAKGMEYLHSRGVFHRDLTSKNVLIKKDEKTGEMTAVVGDFGLAAKIPDPSDGYRLATVGSPYWMSPECLKGQWYDEKSDVFSYGIVLCELIARCEADPDVLPRTENFGLDYLAFADMCGPCPPDFLKLAFRCCNFEPKSRPSFTDIVKRTMSIIADYDRDDDDSTGDQLNKSDDAKCPTTKLLASGLGAKSEEVIPLLTGAGSGGRKEGTHHKKLSHRRSLSEETGSIVFPPHTAPSDKARCHFLAPSRLTAQHVGESMRAQDPHYVPNSGDRANPFAALSQFRGVKKILGGPNKGGLAPDTTDLFSSCFELPSPFLGPPTPDGWSPNSSSWLENLAWKHPKLKRTDRPCKELGEEKSAEQVDDASIFGGKNVFCERGLKRVEVEVECDVASAPEASDATKTSNPRKISQPLSLPGSPTLMRRRLLTNSTPTPPDDNVDTIVEPKSSAERPCDARKANATAAGSLFAHPLFKCGDSDGTTSLGQRSCSSTLNLADVSLLLGEDPMAGYCQSGLRRRGSCESGFFSSIGEDYGPAASDLLLLSPEFGAMRHARARAHNTSSATLSSSSAASSLFLLDDSAASTATDEARPSHHPSLLFAAKRSSSIYTDSSEDVSSVGGGDPHWDGLASRPQHISRIVEYFERKQSCSDGTRHQRDMMFHGYGNVSPVEFARRMEGASLNDAMRSSKIAHLRGSLEREPACPTNRAPAPVVVTGAVRRTVNATQRLMICEGAVKSKLPLFDKK